MILNKVYPKTVGPSTLTTGSVLYFTADKRYMVERWMFTNIAAADSTVTLYIVPSGSSVGNSYKILNAVTIPVNDQTSIQIPIVLEVGTKVYALAGDASAINFYFNINDVEFGVQ